ncbi:hypothetical protein KUTeg_007916 [Tegillarca granosa]|uniref:Uncharacterized protein n=1 Tax=Tegillarca granosa TaxID=220873 RepID=A0ABQ9FGJ2_TEGGR|nr:hypothetical protein KUTeg_007916 [Tegillarca granosa]
MCKATEELNLQPGEGDDYNCRTIVGTAGSDLTLPDVSTIAFSDWLKDLANWDTEHLQRYKEDKSNKLYQQNHVDNVRLYPIPNSDTREDDQPYTTWIRVDRKGVVKLGGCTCVAKLQQTAGLDAYFIILVWMTVQCEWDKPRQTSNPTEVTTLQFKKKGDACKEYGSVSLHTLDYSSDEYEVDVGVFQNFQEILQNASLDFNEEELLNNLRNVCTND